MQKPLSVNDLNLQIKGILEQTFLSVYVEGEISNLVIHTSGHIYFTLKDSLSSIKCVLFRGNAQYLDFKPQNGQKIIVIGGLSVYPPRGDYQILCKKLISSTMGDLYQAYEELKRKLEAKGYFQKNSPLPAFPKRIALITSSTGAALQDMLRVASKRWKLTKFLVINTLVQGESAKEDIAKNIAYADTLGVDLIILARGGGSKEDLWAFNEEIVANAIFEAKTPIISAIGHESDVLISDFVADLRAPTPSASIENALPDQVEWLYKLQDLRDLLSQKFLYHLRGKKQLLEFLGEKYKLANYENKISTQKKQIEDLKQMFHIKFSLILQNKSSALTLPKMLKEFNPLLHFQKSLENLKAMYMLQDPQSKCQSGYAQITQNGEIKQLQDLSEGEVFELSNPQTSRLATLLPKN